MADAVVTLPSVVDVAQVHPASTGHFFLLKFPTAHFKIFPLYRLVVHKILYSLSLTQLEQIQKNIDILIKQRDDNVQRMYRTMLLLASLLVVIFLTEQGTVKLGKDVQLGGASVSIVDSNTFIFIALLTGNFVALLYSTIFVKMFMLEALIESYAGLTVDARTQYINHFSYGFTAFLYGFVASVGTEILNKKVRSAYKYLHLFNIYGLPVFYIIFYLYALFTALRLLHFVNTGLGITLVVFNILTLSIYAFSFIPCVIRCVADDEREAFIRTHAYDLWEASGQPEGRTDEIWLLAEKQARLSGRIR